MAVLSLARGGPGLENPLCSKCSGIKRGEDWKAYQMSDEGRLEHRLNGPDPECRECSGTGKVSDMGWDETPIRSNCRDCHTQVAL